MTVWTCSNNSAASKPAEKLLQRLFWGLSYSIKQHASWPGKVDGMF